MRRLRRLRAYLPWVGVTVVSAVRAYRPLDRVADEREAAEEALNRSIWRYLK